MKHRMAALALVLGVFAVACGGKVADDGDESASVQLGTASPDAFFGQFVYKREGELAHRYPTTTTHGKLASGDAFRADLFMKKDGGYTLRYVELTKEDALTLAPTHETLVTGSWRVEGGKLVLDGLSTADGAIAASGAPAIKLRFPRDLASAGLAGQGATLEIATLPVGLE